MAARDKLRDRVQPFLEEGETIQAVFTAQTGPHPYWILLAYGPVFWMKYLIVVATDRSLLVLDASMLLPFKPKALRARLPRFTQIGPVSGLWATSDGLSAALEKRVLVNKRWHRDVAAADQAAGSTPPAPGV